MNDEDKTLQQILDEPDEHPELTWLQEHIDAADDELERQDAIPSCEPKTPKEYVLNQKTVIEANRPKQSKKAKRKSKAEQWTVLPESDDIAIRDKKNRVTVFDICNPDKNRESFKYQPEERRIDATFVRNGKRRAFLVLSPKELAERKKNNPALDLLLARRVFHSDSHANERVFCIPDAKRKELLTLLDAGGIHSPDNNMQCLGWIEALTRHFIHDWIEEQKQPGANKPNAKKQAQHDWINNVRNILADYCFNGSVKQMITVFRKLIQCFDKNLNISISDTVLRRALIKQAEPKT